MCEFLNGHAYYDTGGAGAPLLFLHGAGCDSADWEDVIDILRRGFRAISLDFRGHGNTTASPDKFTIEDLAADVLALIDHLGLKNVFLVGHSLGGMTAIAAARRSKRISGLVLLEGWTALEAGKAFEEIHHYGMLSPEAVKKIHRKYEQTVRRLSQAVWDYFWDSAVQFNGYEFLKNAHIPIYEIYGERGRTETTANKLLIPSNPNIELVWLKNAGHYLPHESPAQIAEKCLERLS